MSDKYIKILDSTLRDGAQSESVSFTVSDKIKLIGILDSFGVSYIEAGNPGSNPTDMELFKKVKSMKLKNSRLCAFGSTARKDISPENDENIRAILSAGTPCVSIFGKSWALHATEILKITPEENLHTISRSIKYLKSKGKEVIFDAEHFFDGYRHDCEYATEVVRIALQSGADIICLCDTNGGLLPGEIYPAVKNISGIFPDAEIGIHCHNDSGCAVANTMTAIDAGATMVQGTFNGLGERCGNANLSTIIPNIKLKTNFSCDGNLKSLYSISRQVAEIQNISVPANKPYVGTGAFAHKGGMHTDGVLKLPKSYEHIDPEIVGNKRRFLMSEISGRSTVLAKLRQYAPDISKSSPEVSKIIESVKKLEHLGYQFEAADASFELISKKILGTFKEHFSMIFYKVIDEFPYPAGGMQACATTCIKAGERTEITAAVGNGPVNALDLALRKAVSTVYPCINKIHLSDYSVRVIDNSENTSALIRVLVESTDGKNTWTTTGVSYDIIEASITAIADSIEYFLNFEYE